MTHVLELIRESGWTPGPGFTPPPATPRRWRSAPGRFARIRAHAWELVATGQVVSIRVPAPTGHSTRTSPPWPVTMP